MFGQEGGTGFTKESSQDDMILTDLEIQKLLDNGLISIEPNPANEAYDSTAVNLTLDSFVRVFRTRVPGFIFDPAVVGYKAAELIRSATDTVIISEQGWELPRGELGSRLD